MFHTFQHFKKQLGHLVNWLDAANGYADLKKFDSNIILGYRLAPDQLPFAFQVRTTCDTAKLGISRVTGRDAPKHEDNEATIDELRTRVKSVIEYLDSFSAKDFEGTETRTVSTPRWGEKTMTAHDYFTEHIVPNFHFHLVHTYALLRHTGVPLGKKDYLGPLTMK